MLDHIASISTFGSSQISVATSAPVDPVADRLQMRRKDTHRVGQPFQSIEIGVPAPPAISTSWWLSPRHLRFASVHTYIALMDLKFWKMRKALVAVAKKLMRAKAGLKRLQVETQRNPA